MVNWEDELKRFLAKKFKEVIGTDIPLENIHTIEMNVDLNLSQLSVEDLGQIYGFAIMKEDFEQAKKVAEELEIRHCTISIDIDEKKHVGSINIYQLPVTDTVFLAIPLKVYPDGMIIDFEKEF
jgi:hypothetical protein